MRSFCFLSWRNNTLSVLMGSEIIGKMNNL